ncbi:hypothetical protein [Rubrobacter aplysinae]|uniref:hypothetical protein n=1 Tax=Rubrobacter aplysinae TaxID=909625 RepID=UPI00064B9A9D|nr:hypothetical protein [Rubrobacter aplysinae]
MKQHLISVRDLLKSWTLARTDLQFEFIVYGSISIIVGAAIALSFIGVSSIAFAPVVLALLAFGGYMAQAYEWRQQQGMSRECVERES